MARSFYVIYVLKTASRTAAIITWCSLTFIIVFWSTYFVTDGFKCAEESSAPVVAEKKPEPAPPPKLDPLAKADLKEMWVRVPGMSKKLGID